jgi:hypothetical protein
MTDSQELLDKPATLPVPQTVADWQQVSLKVFNQILADRYMGLMSRMGELTTDEPQEFHDLMELNECEEARSPAFTIGLEQAETFDIRMRDVKNVKVKRL